MLSLWFSSICAGHAKFIHKLSLKRSRPSFVCMQHAFSPQGDVLDSLVKTKTSTAAAYFALWGHYTLDPLGNHKVRGEVNTISRDLKKQQQNLRKDAWRIVCRAS